MRHSFPVRFYAPWVVLLVVLVGFAGVSCSGDGAGPRPGAQASGASVPTGAPEGFLPFESGYGIRLAYPPGYEVGSPNEGVGGIETVITGPVLSLGSTPEITVGETPGGIRDNEIKADGYTTLFQLRAGEVVSRREVEVPGAAGPSVEVEIVALDRTADGGTVEIRALAVFFNTPSDVSASVSVAALDADFEASRLRDIFPTLAVVR